MPNSFVQHKQCWIGFSLQTGRGVPATTPDVVMPITEEAAMGYDPHYNFFQYADGKMSGPRQYFSGGSWSEGSLQFPVVPGMLVDAGGSGGMADTVAPDGDYTDIGKWMFGRIHTGVAAADYGQGLYATIFRESFHLQERFADVKVTSGKMDVSFGSRAMFDINVIGLCPPTSGYTMNRALADATLVETPPYVFGGCSISLSGASDSLTGNHSISFDNMCATPEEAGTLWGQSYPQYIPNGELATWTGSFDRNYVNATTYAAFLAGTTGAFQMNMVSAGSGTTAVFLFPKIIYTAAPLSIPNSGFLKQAGINWQALASADGDTYAWSILES